jgi:Flp pilus assembly protein TadG
MRIQNRKPHRSSRGSTMVEFAIVFLLLFCFMLAIIDFSRAVYAYHGISNAARDGSRFASLRGSASCSTTPRTFPTSPCPLTTGAVSTYVSGQLSAAGIYNNVVTTPANAGDVAITTTWSGKQGDGTTTCLTATAPTVRDPGCQVQVAVQYKFGFSLPFWSFYQSSAPGLLTMNSTSVVVISQ